MKIIYDGMPASVNSTSVRGRFLAHNHYDRIARAFLGADLVSGKCRLISPTIVQAAGLCGVNRTYVHFALKRGANRREIENGLIPLMPRPVRESITGIDDRELLEVVRLVGVERVLNAAAAVEAAQ
jgi:hypothetical protein